jgi:hypothetical protein
MEERRKKTVNFVVLPPVRCRLQYYGAIDIEGEDTAIGEVLGTRRTFCFYFSRTHLINKYIIPSVSHE